MSDPDVLRCKSDHCWNCSRSFDGSCSCSIKPLIDCQYLYDDFPDGVVPGRGNPNLPRNSFADGGGGNGFDWRSLAFSLAPTSPVGADNPSGVVPTSAIQLQPKAPTGSNETLILLGAGLVVLFLATR